MRVLVLDDFGDGGIELDKRSRSAVVGGESVRLTGIEWRILAELASSGCAVVAKHDLVERVWGDASFATDDALKQRIWSLRRKIGAERIECISGYGYRLSV